MQATSNYQFAGHIIELFTYPQLKGFSKAVRSERGRWSQDEDQAQIFPRPEGQRGLGSSGSQRLQLPPRAEILFPLFLGTSWRCESRTVVHGLWLMKLDGSM